MAYVNDPIADLLTRIRNAVMAKHRYVDIPLSKMSLAIIACLKECGFIVNFITSDEKRKVRVFLRYADGRKSIIHGLKRHSSPGVRKYVKQADIPSILEGLGICILSTSKGVMTGDKAKEENVGGEILCSVW
ncbi:MAG: 30S ribosomal protein S8 [Simkaniaceae bacterium]|nr:30S ribosomal protein S8 [Simkaniaceae bacterium]